MKIIHIPLQLVSEANQRESHWAKHRRKKGQQEIAAAYLRQENIDGLRPTRIGLTRVVPASGKHAGKLMDDDNLAGCFKHVQDAIAKELGMDDGDIKWSYHQIRHGLEHFVDVVMEIP